MSNKAQKGHVREFRCIWRESPWNTWTLKCSIRNLKHTWTHCRSACNCVLLPFFLFTSIWVYVGSELLNFLCKWHLRSVIKCLTWKWSLKFNLFPLQVCFLAWWSHLMNKDIRLLAPPLHSVKEKRTGVSRRSHFWEQPGQKLRRAFVCRRRLGLLALGGGLSIL